LVGNVSYIYDTLDLSCKMKRGRSDSAESPLRQTLVCRVGTTFTIIFRSRGHSLSDEILKVMAFLHI